MVLEALLYKVLNRTLSDYIESFDPDKLKMGVWSGEIKLDNLKLKNSIFDFLNIPLVI